MQTVLPTSLLCAMSATLGATGAQAAPAKPNFIFALADDLGMDGVSCYGADKYKTPNVDALAASGLRFQTAYSTPLCGPSRCCLMTGRYGFRTGGLTNHHAVREDRRELHLGQNNARRKRE